MDTYKKFQELCIQTHKTPYRVAKDTGIASSTFSRWGTGECSPKSDKLIILANYFGVDINYFFQADSDDSEMQIIYNAYCKAPSDIRNAVRKLLDLAYEDSQN